MPSSRAGLRCDGPPGLSRAAPRLVFRSGERVLRLLFAAASAESGSSPPRTCQIILGGLGNASKIFRLALSVAVWSVWTLLSSRVGIDAPTAATDDPIPSISLFHRSFRVRVRSTKNVHAMATTRPKTLLYRTPPRKEGIRGAFRRSTAPAGGRMSPPAPIPAAGDRSRVAGRCLSRS